MGGIRMIQHAFYLYACLCVYVRVRVSAYALSCVYACVIGCVLVCTCVNALGG